MLIIHFLSFFFHISKHYNREQYHYISFTTREWIVKFEAHNQ